MMKERPEKFRVTEGAFNRILNFLSIEECREVIDFLNRRIELMQTSEDNFAKPLEELALSQRVINILKANHLHTVEDMTAFGIDKIKLLRGIGERTFREICRVYFDKNIEAGFGRNAGHSERGEQRVQHRPQ